MELWASQRHDVDTLAQHNYTGLLAIEPGGGKTLLATAAAVESGAGQVLVIAPQGTHGEDGWAGTVKDYAGHELRIMSNKLKGQQKALRDFELGYPGWYAVTPQLFTRVEDISPWTPDMLIVDEIHQLNNPKSQGQRKLSGYGARDKPIAHQSGMRLGLSGTPARNHFERMWSNARFQWPELNGRGEIGDDAFYTWRFDRMEQTEVITGVSWVECSEDEFRHDRKVGSWYRRADGVPERGTPEKVQKFTTEIEPGKLFSEMPCVIQHLRRENCCDFHPNGFLPVDAPQVIPEVIELLPVQKRAIRDLEEQALAWLDEHPLITEIPLTTQQRVRQLCLAVPSVDEQGTVTFAPDAKSPLIDRMISKLELLEDDNVVVFTASRLFAELATARFNAAGISAFEFSGATTATREADKEKFGTEYRVAVVVIAAGGTGLDGLQKVAHTEFWSDRDVDRTNNMQTEARVDRFGVAQQVQRYIFSDDMGYADARFDKERVQNSELAKTLRRK